MVAVMRARLLWIVLSLCAMTGAVTSCGPSGGDALLANTSPAPPEPPLIAVLDAPFGATPNTLRLRAVDGDERAHVVLRADAEALATAGSRVLIAGGGRIDAVDRTGADTQLGPIPDDTTDDLVRGLVASPDGSRWLWASVRTLADGSVRSRVYIDDEVAGPRMLIERIERGRTLQPVAWTSGGPVLSDELSGIGGYVLFRRSFGPASRLDVATGHLTQVADDRCAFSDMAADGAVSCILAGREGPNDGGAVHCTVLRDGTAPVDVTLEPGIQQAGDALFQPQGSLITLASSPALGRGNEAVRTRLIDSHTGVTGRVSFTGLQPVQWLDGSSLLMTRGQDVAGGPPGTYVAALTGAVSQVSPQPHAIGVVR